MASIIDDGKFKYYINTINLLNKNVEGAMFFQRDNSMLHVLFDFFFK